MAESTDATEDPLGKNPFPEDDPRHHEWVDTKRLGKELSAAFLSEMLSVLPAEDASVTEFQDWIVKGAAGLFDILTNAASKFRVLTDEGADAWERILDHVEDFVLSTASNNLRLSFIPEEGLASQLRIQLVQRHQRSMGQMLKEVREAKEAKRDTAANTRREIGNPPTPTAKDTGPHDRIYKESLVDPAPVAEGANVTAAANPDRAGNTFPTTEAEVSITADRERIGSIDVDGTMSSAQPVAVQSRRTDRRASVNAFLLRCNQEPDLKAKLIRKHIWRLAAHQTARQFQYWQAGDDKATDEDERSFRRILDMNPAKFVALLKQMRIIS